MSGIQRDVQTEIMFRAKSRKDGIYVFRGVHYLVKDNYAHFFLLNDGTVLSNHGNFTVGLGKIDIPYGSAKKKFTELAKANQWL